MNHVKNSLGIVNKNTNRFHEPRKKYSKLYKQWYYKEQKLCLREKGEWVRDWEEGVRALGGGAIEQG